MKLFGYRCAQFQPHDGQMIPLLEQLLHLAAEILLVVLKFFIIKADIGVAGHGENTAFLHRIGIEQRRQPAQKNIFRAHETLPIRKQQIRRRTVRNRHNANGFVSLFAFQQRRRIELFVYEMRIWMVRRDHDGRQDRQQLRFEKAVDLLQLARVQCFDGCILDAVLCKRFHNGGIDLLFYSKKPGNGAVNVLQLLRRRPAGFAVRIVRCHVGKIEETAYPHHEEFIEVAGKDRDEFQSLQRGNVWVGRFFQHAPIKAQPAQFPVLGVSVLFFSILWHK